MQFSTIKRTETLITLGNGKQLPATILIETAYDPEPYDIGDAEDAEAIAQGIESGKYSNMVIRVRAMALGLTADDYLGQVLVSSSDEILEVADAYGMADNAIENLVKSLEDIRQAIA